MAITTGNFAKALWPGVNRWYGKEYADHDEEFSKAFEVGSSTRAWEEDTSISSFGLLISRNEGASTSYDGEQQGFITRYTHAEYSLGFVVTRNMFDDDQYDIVGERRAKGLAFSARQSVETVAWNVYNRAFTTAYVGGDAATLVASAGGGGSSTHPNIAGGTWTNGPATAVDLSEASLEQACIDLMAYTNDRGLKISVMPQSLIIPTALHFEAEKILKTPTTPFSAEHTVNAVKGKFPKGVVMSHYLTDSDAWFIRTNVKNGMRFFWRKQPVFSTDNDFDTDNAKFKVVMRFSAGWSDPRQVWGSPGA